MITFPGFVAPDLGLLGEIGRPFLLQKWKEGLSVPVKSTLLKPPPLPGEPGQFWGWGPPTGTIQGQGGSLPQGIPLIPSHTGSRSGLAVGPSPFNIALGSGFYRGKKISWHWPNQGPKLRRHTCS